MDILQDNNWLVIAHNIPIVHYNILYLRNKDCRLDMVIYVENRHTNRIYKKYLYVHKRSRKIFFKHKIQGKMERVYLYKMNPIELTMEEQRKLYERFRNFKQRNTGM